MSNSPYFNNSPRLHCLQELVHKLALVLIQRDELVLEGLLELILGHCHEIRSGLLLE